MVFGHHDLLVCGDHLVGPCPCSGERAAAFSAVQAQVSALLEASPLDAPTGPASCLNSVLRRCSQGPLQETLRLLLCALQIVTAILIWQTMWYFMPGKVDEEPLLQVSSLSYLCQEDSHHVPGATNMSVAVKTAYRSCLSAGACCMWCRSPAAADAATAQGRLCCAQRLLSWVVYPHIPVLDLPVSQHVTSAVCAQTWLQDIAWTEASKEDVLARRVANAEGEHERCKLQQAPLFCYETAISLHRFSALAYMSAPRSLVCSQ